MKRVFKERRWKSRAPVHRETREETPENIKPKREKQRLRKEIEEEIDSMLEEIDGILEDNAQEFIQAYVQKGGQ